MGLELFVNRTIKEMKNIHGPSYLMFLLLLIINMNGLYASTLGKLITLFTVMYIILNENLKLGVLSFLTVLLLNNNSIEGFENKTDNDEKKSEKDDEKNAKDKQDNLSNTNLDETKETSNENNDSTEVNDPIASFKKLHCKNGKVMKDNKEINIADLSSTFPQLKFNLENEKCNPCGDNCDFKITSSTERITVEEQLRPSSSTDVSTE